MADVINDVDNIICSNKMKWLKGTHCYAGLTLSFEVLEQSNFAMSLLTFKQYKSSFFFVCHYEAFNMEQWTLLQAAMASLKLLTAKK